jgi:alpha-1,2-mannosyltransferase
MASAQVTSAKERYASGEWLTPQLMTFTAVLVLAGTIVSLGFLFFTATGTLDRLARPLGTDFSSFWTAGRMALEGNAALAYDWTAH